jgi:thiosulfate reductase cytochrome b subunit
MALHHQPARTSAHSAAIRIMHWVWVYAVGCMVFSGWEIYNASPSLPFSFPGWTGLGGWLGGGLAWHFSAMWLLAMDGMAYLVYGFLSGHFQRELAVPTPRAFLRDFWSALTFRLGHRIGHYNAVQRVLYLGVIGGVVLQVVTGLAIWKPVQLGGLATVLGGYPIARNIHLATMFLIVAFVVVHLTLVAIFPRTLVSMIVSRPAERESRT